MDEWWSMNHMTHCSWEACLKNPSLQFAVKSAVQWKREVLHFGLFMVMTYMCLQLIHGLTTQHKYSTTKMLMMRIWWISQLNYFKLLVANLGKELYPVGGRGGGGFGQRECYKLWNIIFHNAHLPRFLGQAEGKVWESLIFVHWCMPIRSI